MDYGREFHKIRFSTIDESSKITKIGNKILVKKNIIISTHLSNIVLGCSRNLDNSSSQYKRMVICKTCDITAESRNVL